MRQTLQPKASEVSWFGNLGPHCPSSSLNQVCISLTHVLSPPHSPIHSLSLAFPLEGHGKPRGPLLHTVYHGLRYNFSHIPALSWSS